MTKASYNNEFIAGRMNEASGHLTSPFSKGFVELLTPVTEQILPILGL
jgi:hypothetical protein